MALAGAGRTDQDGVVALGDEFERVELEAGAPGDLGVVAPVELGERGALVQAAELEAALQEPGLPAVELVLQERAEGDRKSVV